MGGGHVSRRSTPNDRYFGRHGVFVLLNVSARIAQPIRFVKSTRTSSNMKRTCGSQVVDESVATV